MGDQHDRSLIYPAFGVKLLALSCAFALCGCTVATFTKPGGTEAEFRKDNYECERDAAMAGLGTGLAAAGMHMECMEARGYTRVQ
jgi:hypothetical protein